MGEEPMLALHTHPLADWAPRELLALIGRMRDGDAKALRHASSHVQRTALTYDEAHDQDDLQSIFDGWAADQYAVLRGAH